MQPGTSASTARAQTVTKRFKRITESGQPCKIPLVDFQGDPTACIETEHDSSTDESDVQEDFFDERGEEFEADYEQDSAQ